MPMSITLELPHELEKELATEAAQFGLSLPEYVLRVLSAGYPLGNKPKTGAELVEYWQGAGAISMRPEIADSRAHARRIRNKAERRMRK
jgi:hypothetical protein